MAILGIDEAGRGPWAGPLCIGAAILSERYDKNGKLLKSEAWQESLADSKKLSAKKRTELATIIKQKATATALGWVSAAEIDDIGLAQALSLAARRAVKGIPKGTFSEIIIDGTSNFLRGTTLEQLVSVLPKADAKIKEVSAASIIAKVARDDYMKKLAAKYPDYAFERHVGYGTALHRELLEQHGPCPEHRLSFKPVQKIAQKFASTPTTEAMVQRAEREKLQVAFQPESSGAYAEQIVADYLKAQQHHSILARNHKTKFYEIDIVSATKDHIYFTEVKYRKSHDHGSPLDYIDKKKQQQIKFAAESFMKYLSKQLGRPLDQLPSPVIAAASVSGKEFKLDKWLPIVV